MSKQKTTPWFPGTVKPVHVGVYETDAYLPGRVLYQHWNGSFFGFAGSTPQEALKCAGSESRFQHDKWRGLASKDGK